MKKIIKPKDCYDCPFHADTYEVSYKEIDDASFYCIFYKMRIGGERSDNDSMQESNKNFPDFCKVRKITVEGAKDESKD